MLRQDIQEGDFFPEAFISYGEIMPFTGDWGRSRRFYILCCLPCWQYGPYADFVCGRTLLLWQRFNIVLTFNHFGDHWHFRITSFWRPEQQKRG